jgi:hypothetical protein
LAFFLPNLTFGGFGIFNFVSNFQSYTNMVLREGHEKSVGAIAELDSTVASRPATSLGHRSQRSQSRSSGRRSVAATSMGRASPQPPQSARGRRRPMTSLGHARPATAGAAGALETADGRPVFEPPPDPKLARMIVELERVNSRLRAVRIGALKGSHRLRQQRRRQDHVDGDEDEEDQSDYTYDDASAEDDRAVDSDGSGNGGGSLGDGSLETGESGQRSPPRKGGRNAQGQSSVYLTALHRHRAAVARRLAERNASIRKTMARDYDEVRRDPRPLVDVGRQREKSPARNHSAARDGGKR